MLRPSPLRSGGTIGGPSPIDPPREGSRPHPGPLPAGEGNRSLDGGLREGALGQHL